MFQRQDSTSSVVSHPDVVEQDGYLWKRGRHTGLMTQRFYSLTGNVLYDYANPTLLRSPLSGLIGGCGCTGLGANMDVAGAAVYSPLREELTLRNVVFMTGYKIYTVDDPELERTKKRFGFKIVHTDPHYDALEGKRMSQIPPEKRHLRRYRRRNERTFYASSAADRAKWLAALHTATTLCLISDEFTIGKELGNGRFSTVKLCTHKTTGEHSAVKIIDKRVLKPDEKEFLRTEIAVLKVIDHPYLVKLEGLFETKHHIRIVCELLAGGELYDRVMEEPEHKLTEHNCSRCLIPLLEAVAYLHSKCIAHRDLKPENILCGDILEEIKIADFGLSKTVAPTAKLIRCCGTLSYVAPEVLEGQGYGVQCDMWSVGVIMYQLLCVRLPFDGDSNKEIIEKIKTQEPRLHPTAWEPLSADAKDLILKMLVKDPSKRITAREALEHPFIRHHRTPVSSPALRSVSRDEGGASVGIGVGVGDSYSGYIDKNNGDTDVSSAIKLEFDHEE